MRLSPAFVLLLSACPAPMPTDAGSDAPPDAAWRSTLYPADWTPAHTDDAGRFMHDVSYAGFGRGERTPAPPSRELRVVNDGGDMTAGVQAALDEASRDGGVVLLAAGDWRLDGTLTVRGSHVVLRGAGREATRLHFTKTFGLDSLSELQLGAVPTLEGDWPLQRDAAPRERSVWLTDAGALQPGDHVALGHVITDAYVEAHGMTGTWRAFNGSWQPFEWREVVSVAADGEVRLDVPVRSPLLLRDGASLRRATGLLHDVGVEDLSFTNAIDPGSAYAMSQVHVVGLSGVVDGFVRRVASFSPDGGAHVQSGGVLVLQSKRVTVADVELGLAQHRGSGGNGYLFEVRQSSDVLFRDCVAHDGRHNFIQNWGFGTTGVVWLRVRSSGGFATSTPGGTQGGVGYSEFHHSLATANLIDSCRFDDGFSIVNRRLESTGAGHTGTQNVLWNVSGTGLVRSMQWGWGAVIGTTDVRVALDEVFIGEGTAPLELLEGLDAGATLEPASLYEDQLRRRLGAP